MIQECHWPLGYGRVSTDQGLEVRTQVSGFPAPGSGSDLLVIITRALSACLLLCHQILQAHQSSTLIIYVSLFKSL